MLERSKLFLSGLMMKSRPGCGRRGWNNELPSGQDSLLSFGAENHRVCPDLSNLFLNVERTGCVERRIKEFVVKR